jgi:hypothetical protein
VPPAHPLSQLLMVSVLNLSTMSHDEAIGMTGNRSWLPSW